MTVTCWALALSALMLAPGGVSARTAPATAPLSADPPRDVAHPARLVAMRYPTGGVQVPARLFVAAGAGPHPTVLLLHGFPGTELNLDLARDLQRAGWTVLAIHYRGVWGAPGQFSFTHVIEDAHAALGWLRSPAAAEYGIDQHRIVAIGHSMGGFAAAMLGDDKALAGYALISAADMGAFTRRVATADAAGKAEFADDASYTNASVDALIADARAHATNWDWRRRTGQMAGRPVLVVTSDDGLAATGAAAADAIAAAGGPEVASVHLATDHSYNDQRIALSSAVEQWLHQQIVIGRSLAIP